MASNKKNWMCSKLLVISFLLPAAKCTTRIQSWLDLFSFCFSLSKDLLSQFISILIPGLLDRWLNNTIPYTCKILAIVRICFFQSGRGINWLKWVKPRPWNSHPTQINPRKNCQSICVSLCLFLVKKMHTIL